MAEKSKSKREKRKEIEAILKDGVVTNTIFVRQRQPWTFVVFTVYWNSEYCELFGFSKVQHPDTWDADYGVEMAKKKAIAAFAKEVINGEE